MSQPVSNPRIILVTGAQAEVNTRDALIAVLEKFNLSDWLYTDTIQVHETNGPSYSHPILTINAASSANQIRLLSTYVHEQLHWFLFTDKPRAGYLQAWDELRTLYPDLPILPPDGCGSERSNYLHIMVCYLEHISMIKLVGLEAARCFLERKPFYKAIYRLVAQDGERIREVLDRYDLVPEHLKDIGL